MINKLCGADIEFSHGNEWQVDFIKMLSKRFTELKLYSEIKERGENSLVIMSQYCGGLHMGIVKGGAVHHNYKPSSGAGSVIISDTGTIRAEYKRVRFYEYNQNI